MTPRPFLTPAAQRPVNPDPRLTHDVVLRVIARVYPKVSTGEARDGVDCCWTWRGAHQGSPSGARVAVTTIVGAPMPVARVLWELEGYPPLDGARLVNRRDVCGNPGCVRPTHYDRRAYGEGVAQGRGVLSLLLTATTPGAPEANDDVPPPVPLITVPDRRRRATSRVLRLTSAEPASASAPTSTPTKQGASPTSQADTCLASFVAMELLSQVGVGHAVFAENTHLHTPWGSFDAPDLYAACELAYRARPRGAIAA